MKTVIITGASGFIGGFIRDTLVHQGYHVIAYQRRSQKDEARVEYHCFSLEGKVPEEPFTRADHIIHCAYQPYSSKHPEADANNLKGTQQLLVLSRKYGVHFTFLSTMSAHTLAQSHYGKNKLEIEGLFDPEKELVLRLGLVLGEGGLFRNMSQLIQQTKFIPLIGGGRQPLQTIAIKDLTSVLMSAMEQKTVGMITLAHPDVVLMKDLYKALATKHPVKPKFVSVPLGMVLLACRMVEAVGINLPITSENILGLKHLQAEPTESEVLGVRLISFDETLEGL